MKGNRKIGIITQVAVFFAIGLLVTGLLSFVVQRLRMDQSVKGQLKKYCSEISEEVNMAVKEYPACNWLLDYWYVHYDALDVEYDSHFGAGTTTEEKCRLMRQRHPDLQLKYATAEQLEALPKLDQDLYAEIVYSWLTIRINQIKQAYKVDYLFCLLTDEACTTQFFVFSGADANSVRGTEYEQVYPLGKVVSVVKNDSQREAMRDALRNNMHLALAGHYLDYYAYMDTVGSHIALVGITQNLSSIKTSVRVQTAQSMIFAIIYQVVLSMICLALIYRFVLRPLRKVQHGIRVYQETKDSAAVCAELSEVRSRNEIGELSDGVGALSREIDDYLDRIASITAEKQRIDTELTLAARIQEGMLPSVFPPFPDRHEFEIYASMDPAKEVGGDFYDFFLIDGDHLCMVMADVSGKGIPAALFMMASKIILANNAKLGQSPARVLEVANAAICANSRQDMFVTVWLGILEISTGRLVAANAGHEYPALKPADGAFALYRDRHGFVVGGMDGVRYREYELQMHPGDALFLYTDGVPEAMNAEGSLFGTERMLAALNAERDTDPEKVLSRVRGAVDGFVNEAEQFDDLTMLCMTYRGPEGEAT